MRTVCLFLLVLVGLNVWAQDSDDGGSSTKGTEPEIGLKLFGLRGYDISKDISGARDKYQMAIAPGVFYVTGNQGKKLRLSLMYEQASISGKMNYRRLISSFGGPSSADLQFQRQCMEARIGYLRIFNADDKSNVKAYYSADLVYGYGRQKFGVVFNPDNGSAAIIGYQFSSIGLVQTFGLRFNLKSDFSLYAETGFAIDSQFGLRNYNYANIDFNSNRFTISANFRALQIGLSRKISNG